MSMARRPSPFGELLSLRQAMDRLFEDSYVRSRGVPYGSVEAMTLPLDIYSTPEAIVVEAALPGVKPEDVEITVLGNTLTIQGTSYEERSSEQAEFMYQELRRGTFSRTVALPSNLDTHASMATFEHGMLRLTIPRAAEAKPRTIRITTTHDSTASDGGQAEQEGGNDSWAAGSAEGIGQVDEGTGQETGADASADWEPAAGTDAWTEPGATDTWAAQEGVATDAWSDPTATPSSDTWATPDPAADGTAAEWQADTGAVAQEWQPEAAAEWQPEGAADPAVTEASGEWSAAAPAPTGEEWQGDGAQADATAAEWTPEADPSTAWTPEQTPASGQGARSGEAQGRG